MNDDKAIRILIWVIVIIFLTAMTHGIYTVGFEQWFKFTVVFFVLSPLTPLIIISLILYFLIDYRNKKERDETNV